MNSKLIKVLFLLTPLTILADGQHDPADIPKFLQALKSGADHAEIPTMVKYHEASNKANPYSKDSTSSGQCYGPSSKTDTNINTRRNLLSYIHHAVHTPPPYST